MRVSALSLACLLGAVTANAGPTAFDALFSQRLRGMNASMKLQTGDSDSLPMPGSIPPGFCDGVWEWESAGPEKRDFEEKEAKHPKQLELRADGLKTEEECAALTKFGAVTQMEELRDANFNLRAYVFEALSTNGQGKRTLMCINQNGAQRHRACAIAQANKGVPVDGEVAAPRLHDAWKCGDGKGEYVACIEMDHITPVGDNDFDDDNKAVAMGTQLIDRAINMMDRGVITNKLWRESVAQMDDHSAVQGDFGELLICKDTVPMFIRPLMLGGALVEAAWNYMGSQELLKEAGKIWEQVAAGKHKSGKMPAIPTLSLVGSANDLVSDMLQEKIRSNMIELDRRHQGFDVTDVLVHMHLLDMGVFVYMLDRAEVTVEMKDKNQKTAKVTGWSFSGAADRWGKNGDEMLEKIRLAAVEQCPPLAAWTDDGTRGLAMIKMMMGGITSQGRRSFKWETKEVAKEGGVVAYTYSVIRKDDGSAGDDSDSDESDNLQAKSIVM